MLVHIAISGQSLVSGAMQIMSSMPSPKGLKPNLSAKKAKEKRKVKGKGKGKNYYNTKEFKIASKRVYKNWPYNWTPKFRRGLLHTNSQLPTNLQLRIKHHVPKSAKIMGKILTEKMTKEREQTIGTFTTAKDLHNSLNFCWNHSSFQKISQVYDHILKIL